MPRVHANRSLYMHTAFKDNFPESSQEEIYA